MGGEFITDFMNKRKVSSGKSGNEQYICEFIKLYAAHDKKNDDVLPTNICSKQITNQITQFTKSLLAKAINTNSTQKENYIVYKYTIETDPKDQAEREELASELLVTAARNSFSTVLRDTSKVVIKDIFIFNADASKGIIRKTYNTVVLVLKYTEKADYKFFNTNKDNTYEKKGSVEKLLLFCFYIPSNLNPKDIKPSNIFCDCRSVSTEQLYSSNIITGNKMVNGYTKEENEGKTYFSNPPSTKDTITPDTNDQDTNNTPNDPPQIILNRFMHKEDFVFNKTYLIVIEQFFIDIDILKTNVETALNNPEHNNLLYDNNPDKFKSIDEQFEIKTYTPRNY